MNKNLILLQINELNFDLVNRYLRKFPDLFLNLRKLYSFKQFTSFSENEYQNIEPWIQWASVYTGMKFDAHRIFRLGDSIFFKGSFIHEEIEKMGFSVGAISSINLPNRLKNPTIFIPDPWTNTPADNSFLSKKIHAMLKDAVNNNANSKISIRSLLIIFYIFLKFVKIKDYLFYFRIAFKSLKKKWLRALFLDSLISNISVSLIKDLRPNFISVFFNSAAHIQHHYFYNFDHGISHIKNKNPEVLIGPSEDPFYDTLVVFDRIIGEFIELDFDILLATGLTQVPYPYTKYYWRLKDHNFFLNFLKLKFLSVEPLMSRDFKINFDNKIDLDNAYQTLSSIKIKGSNINLFSDLTINEFTIFVTLAYPEPIVDTTHFIFEGKKHQLLPFVNLVALKNGMHSEIGFVFCSSGINMDSISGLENLHSIIIDYFK